MRSSLVTPEASGRFLFAAHLNWNWRSPEHLIFSGDSFALPSHLLYFSLVTHGHPLSTPTICWPSTNSWDTFISWLPRRQRHYIQPRHPPPLPDLAARSCANLFCGGAPPSSLPPHLQIHAVLSPLCCPDGIDSLTLTSSTLTTIGFDDKGLWLLLPPPDLMVRSLATPSAIEFCCPHSLPHLELLLRCSAKKRWVNKWDFDFLQRHCKVSSYISGLFWNRENLHLIRW